MEVLCGEGGTGGWADHPTNENMFPQTNDSSLEYRIARPESWVSWWGTLSVKAFFCGGSHYGKAFPCDDAGEGADEEFDDEALMPDGMTSSISTDCFLSDVCQPSTWFDFS